MDALKCFVMEKLQWTELEYCTFQYEQGLVYLQHHFMNLEQMIPQFESSKIFWRWWMNQWMDLDSVFEHSMRIGNPSVQTLKTVYHGLHNGQVLAEEMKMQNVVIEETINS